MDDPLIGLTIYDTTKSYDNSSSQRSDGYVKDGANEMLLRENVDDTHEECFPCLPSLPDNLEKKKAEASTPRSILDSGNSSGDAMKASQHRTDNEEPYLPTSHLTSQPKNFWLMRLFQSSLFDMSIAIGYLFNSKDSAVQSYLGSRLFVSVVVKICGHDTCSCYIRDE